MAAALKRPTSPQPNGLRGAAPHPGELCADEFLLQHGITGGYALVGVKKFKFTQVQCTDVRVPAANSLKLVVNNCFPKFQTSLAHQAEKRRPPREYLRPMRWSGCYRQIGRPLPDP